MGFEVATDPYTGLNFEQLSAEELEKAAIRTQEYWRENLRDAGWVDRGEAVNDVTVVKVDETTFHIGGDVVQLAIAEFGRPAGGSPPPYDDIAEWAKRKGIRPNEDQTFESMVDAIRFSIAEDGIEGFSAGQRAAKEAARNIERDVSERIDRDLEDT